MEQKKVIETKQENKDDANISYDKARALERFLRNPFDLAIKAELKKYYKLKKLVVRAAVENDKFDLVIDMKTLDGNFKKVAKKGGIELFEMYLPAGEKYIVKAFRKKMLFFKDSEEKSIVLNDDMEVVF